MVEQEKYVTAAEAAKMLRVKPQTIRVWATSGATMPGGVTLRLESRPLPKGFLFTSEAIDRFLDAVAAAKAGTHTNA